MCDKNRKGEVVIAAKRKTSGLKKFTSKTLRTFITELNASGIGEWH